MQTGDYQKALKLFDRVLKRLPGDPYTLTSKGHAYKTRGQYDEAVASYRAALESQPRHGEAWYSLSNLKVYTFDRNEIGRMRAQAGDRNLAQNDRIHLCFALGKAYEDRGDYEASFRYYEQGNRLKKASGNYDAGQMTEDLRAQQRVCTADALERAAEAGHSAGRSDLRRRAAAGRLNAAGTDPFVPFKGRWHAGTAQRPVTFAAFAPARTQARRAGLPGNTGDASG